MKKLIAAAAIALSGCATQPPAPIAEYSSARLCEIAVRGNFWVSQDQALSEIARRGENCNAHMGVINARIGIEAQSLDLLKQSQPQFRPLPMPRQQVCTTRRIGDAYQTICD